ncbi:hypothetical protein [Vibrio hepatarius]|uniref:hypothetical protein n=1 Tax=Vibrio hepatarius TaxID=171383 RepID=UPI001C085982|nr:hypothetical protein [Vibrio hepatarius]MBU2896039.1 hypothetical protein [Vibrio hepatarius]
MFRPYEPSLESYIQSNRAFSLELVHGINGQRRPLTKDILEAHDAHRAIELQKYINHFNLNDGEVQSLLDEKKSGLDPSQIGWVKKSLHEVISNSTRLDPATRDQISFGLVTKRDGVDLVSEIVDFSKIGNDKIAASVFDLSKGSVHHEAVSILVNEIYNISQQPEEDPTRKHNPRGNKIEALLTATNEDTFENLFLKVYQMNQSVVGSSNEVTPDKFKEEESKLNDATLGMPNLREVLSSGSKIETPFMVPRVSTGSVETAKIIQGCISSNAHENFLNFTPNVDLSLEMKKLIDSIGVEISTEHSMFAGFKSKANTFDERIGGEFKSEKSESNDISLFNRLKSKTKDKLKKLTSKDDNLGDKEKIDWSVSDYNWHNKADHFSTENYKPIKSMTFSDKYNKPIFIHKPTSGLGFGSTRFGNTGGTILFSKGRKITQDEANLIVAQFLRTNTICQMYITPPKHLENKESSQRHVELLVISALEYGVPVENINVRPNGMVNAEQFQEIVERATLDMKAGLFEEFGGLSDTADMTIEAPKDGVTAKVKNDDVIVRVSKEKP